LDLYWRNSFLYRVLRYSFFAGWLVAGEKTAGSSWYTTSLAYRWGARFRRRVENLLYGLGDVLRRLGQDSLVIRQPFALLGMALFLYFALDIAVHGPQGMALAWRVAAGLAGLGLASLPPWRDVCQGSRLVAFLRWWNRN